jgi:hypothetical protein
MAGRFFAPLILCLLLAFAPGGISPASAATSRQPEWSQLNAQQRTALAPLVREWNRLSDDRRQRWLGIARRYPQMSDIEQARIQDRMREWVLLSPHQRDEARIQYLRLHQQLVLPADLDLTAKWQEYSALPAEERLRLRESAAARRQRESQRLVNPAAGQRPPQSGLAVTPSLPARFILAPLGRP